ncbi:MAG: hypothetical protein INR62_07045 [Rhodospirillales bacterium]|nr:hypothetical protein [Acetobacter sp.]
MTHFRRAFLLAFLCLALDGCSIVGESAHNASEESASIPAGSIVAGDGFSVRSPALGLHVVRDQPRRGFLSLRSTSREMSMGGGTYNVYPFSLDPPVSTLREAWSAHALAQFSAQGRAAYHILTEHTGTWRGQAAYFQSAYTQQSAGGGGAVVSGCVLQRGARYYWVVRSISVSDGQPETIRRARTRAEQELPTFLNSLTFSSTPAT